MLAAVTQPQFTTQVEGCTGYRLAGAALILDDSVLAVQHVDELG